MRCPCCKRRVRGPQIIFDLQTNTVFTGAGSARLSPSLAELGFILRTAAPDAVPQDRVIRHLYGHHRPTHPGAALRTFGSRLRMSLTPLGWTVELVPSADNPNAPGALRLAKIEETSHAS